MSRKIRFAAVLLVLVSLTTGSLGALPFGFRSTAPAENLRGDFLAALVQWIASLFAPERPSEGTSKQPQQKDCGTMDPNGSCGGH